jgi:hypothetical protein
MPSKTYEQISRVTLTSNASGLSFANIPQTYTDLRVVIQFGYGNAGYCLGLRFNDDSGQNYCSRHNFAYNNSASYNQKNDFVFGGINIAIASPDQFYSVAVIDFLDYTQTDAFKTYISRHGNAGATAADTTYGVGHWFKSSKEAITKISFAESGDGGSGTFNTGNLIAGTVAVLYGIKAGS